MRKYRALIVGAGKWARGGWGRCLRDSDRVEIVGWVDILPEAVDQALQELDLPEAAYKGPNLDEGIRASNADFVVNLTFPSSHRDVTIEALEAGVPVLCEKPMADTLDQALEMVRASERTGKLLMISQQRRYDPRLAAMRQLIRDRLGSIEILDSEFYRASGQNEFMHSMSSPLLLDMAIHTFDAARFACEQDAVSVYCEHFDPSWSWYAGKASAIAIFDMTHGLRYTYRGSWCAPGFETPWEARWRAVGAKGTVLWNGAKPPEAEVIAESEPWSGKSVHISAKVEGEVSDEQPIKLRQPLKDFLNALEFGTTPMGECHDNLNSLAMVFAAIESAETGERVSIQRMIERARDAISHQPAGGGTGRRA